MNEFAVELPPEVWAEVARRAGFSPGGEAAWVVAAVQEKLAHCSELEYLEGRATRGNRTAFEGVLAKVPAVAPMPGDER